MTELADLDASELLALYREGSASPEDAVLSCLSRIESIDSSVGAVLTLIAGPAIRQARDSTRRWRSEQPRLLEGVPYGLKDIIQTAGIRSTGGSALYNAYYPSEDAAVAARLADAGAILVAKLSTYEFAAGVNSATSNPWDLERTTCGSSSGSAAAVAARELPIAIGTDTGGSIAIPAAFCGVTGLKPTYGRVSRYGIMPLSWTLDHVGPITRSALDSSIALGAMAGFDDRDPTSCSVKVDDYVEASRVGIGEMRIGLPTDWFFDTVDPPVERAVREAAFTLRGAGAELVEIDLPSTRDVNPHAIELTVIGAEAASLHEGTYDRIGEYGPEFQRVLDRGQFISAMDYLKALRARYRLQLDFEEAFKVVDAVLVPGCVTVAPRHDELVARIGSYEMPWLDVISRTTAIFDMVGLPTVTFPVGFDDLGLPIGASVACRPWAEGACLRVARAYQSITDYHRRRPAVTAGDTGAKSVQLEIAERLGVLERPVVTQTVGRSW